MGRERKLTKWILISNSGKYRTITAAAERLGISRSNLYIALKDFGIAIETFLSAIETHSNAARESMQRVESAEIVPTVEELREAVRNRLSRELESFGWAPHECPGQMRVFFSEDCSVCRKTLQALKAAQAALQAQREHEVFNCWCGKQHAVDPANHGLSPRPTWGKLALSYGPRKAPWER